MSERLSFDVKLEERDHEAAIDRVTAALAEEGFGVLSRIDVHSALKKKLGVDFRPYSILGACNPQFAHQALQANPEIGVLLPCNVAVEAAEDGQGTVVRVGDPEVLLSTGGMNEEPGLKDLAEEVKSRLQRVAIALR